MLRALHRWPGLIAALFVTLLGLSGAVLALYPAFLLPGDSATPGQSVADLAARVQAANPGVSEIARAASGQVTAYLDGSPAAVVIDPATGAAQGPVTATPMMDWLVELHRSLFLADGGRIVMAAAALAMLVLAGSGLVMLARRSGGWRRLLAPQKGKGGFHAWVARAGVLGLTISAVTALWMTANTFGLLPQSDLPAFPAQVSGQAGIAVDQVAMLRQVPVAALDQLVFPLPGDPTDVFTLKTSAGQGYLDQGTGALLAWSPASAWDWLTRLLIALHTGRGAPMMGLVLGLSALSLPILAWTGLMQVLAPGRRRTRSAPASKADVVVLVGSEGGATWGFAETLRAALAGQGLAVHVAPLKGFAPRAWPKAQLALILASTYGAGEAPASAGEFLAGLRALPKAPDFPVAVLGFGDRSFPDFCAYAQSIAAEAEAKGWPQLLPFATVDRQSAQDFARWGRDLAQALRLDFDLHHMAERPASQALTLVSRRDYGVEVQAPTAILRFALPEAGFWQRLFRRDWRYRAGDLLAILPEGTSLPRFYSLASSHGDGFLEICVRQHPGGLCSSQLLALEPGQSIQAFLRVNRGFHPAPGRAPVILIGAGTGVGPLAGFARANAGRRPMHLYFGLRHPDSDLLYREELRDWLEAGQLTRVSAAFSRAAPQSYVQDVLKGDGAQVVRLVQSGAQILVCGGREMAAGVRAALDDILLPLGLSPAGLRAEGRYAEDVY